MSFHTTFDLNSSFKAFLQDPEWPFKTTIGGFINYMSLGVFVFNPALTPICFVLAALSTGYLLRSLRMTAGGEMEKLPAWNDQLDLIISGLSWLSIAAGFFFFAMSVLAISLMAGAGFDLSNVSKPNFLIWSESTFLFLFFLSFGQNFFLSILMANFAQEERMAAGFAWRKVLRRIKMAPLELGTVWLAGSTMTLVALTVPTMTVIGALFTPFCYFLAQIISTRMIGQTWAYLDMLENKQSQTGLTPEAQANS